MMECRIRRFSELSADELFKIYRVRVSVFVVEQACPYQEVDDTDRKAVHMWLEEEGRILAYLRVFPDPEDHRTIRIGRVLATERRKGYAGKLLEEALREIEKDPKTERIYLEAQTYAKSLYEKLGFVSVTEEFLEDGIPHVGMERRSVREARV